MNCIREACAVILAALLLTACAGATDPAATTGPEAEGVAEPTAAVTTPTDAAAVPAAPSLPEGDPLRLIFLTNESGPFANLSADAALGVRARVDALNESGGVLGRPLEVQTLNTESDPTRATAVAESIQPADDLIGVIGPEGAGTCFAVRSVLIEKGIIHYCNSGAPIPGASDGLIPGEFSPYYFMLHPPIQAAAVDVPFEWMAANGYETMALITSSDASGQLYTQVVQAGGFDDVQIVATETFDAASADVTPQMTNIRSADPDVIYVGTTGAGLATVLQASQDLGIDAAIWAGWGNAANSVAELVSGLLPEGGLFTYGEAVHVIDDLPAGHPQAEALEEAAAMWQDEFGATISVDGALMWDAVSNLAAAVEGAGTPEPDAMVAWLEEDADELVGLAGIYDFSAEDHRGTRSSGFVIRFTEEGVFSLELVIDTA